MSILDFAARDIYAYTDRDDMNSWLRTLAAIRGLPQRWPTRYGSC